MIRNCLKLVTVANRFPRFNKQSIQFPQIIFVTTKNRLSIRFLSTKIMVKENGTEVESKRMKTDGGKVIGTHDGVFHCDELLACFMLQQLPEYSDAIILRTRDQKKLDECDIVVDVGSEFNVERKRFDHHQREFKETMSSLKPELGPNYTIRLSSAGLIYCFYGEQIIRKLSKDHCNIDIDAKCLKVIYKKIYESFIREIDAIDNGVPMFDGEPKWTISTNLSSRVGHFNEKWNEKEKYDAKAQFEKAKALVGSELLDKIVYYVESWWPAREIVQKAIENRFSVHESGEILELENFCPWKQHLAELEPENGIEGVPKYVLYKGGKENDYRVICVPNTPDSFVCRKFLHKDWRGIRDEEFQKVSGIPDTSFCHATGFIGGAKTREAAFQMALKSLKATYTD